MISIITVAFNAKEELKETLESVLAQQNHDGSPFTDYECIVVDGGSQDGSTALFKGYEERFAAAGIHFDARSEKDGGIYDGMNKGICRSCGEWVYFLNAGDVFYSRHVLCEIAPELTAADVVYGDVCSFITQGGKRREYIMKSGDDMEAVKTNLPFCHQAVFTRKALHKDRLYSTEYVLAADYEFFLTAWLEGAKFRHVPVIVAMFALDGASNKKRRQLFLEYEKIHQDNNLARTGAAGVLAHAWGICKTTIAGLMPEGLVYSIMKKRIDAGM